MTDTTAERAQHEHDDGARRGIWGRIELIAAILLGVAGILTAYAAFQGALADGNSLDKYTESSKLTSDANGYYSDGKQQYGQDLALFTQYQILVESGQQDTADVIKDNLFSAELLASFEVWDLIPAEDSPPTPLDMEVEYLDQLTDYTEGGRLTGLADDSFTEAQAANDEGDQYELAAVFLAVALFLAGIASLFKERAIQAAMLAGSVLLIVPGVLAIMGGKGWI